MEWQHNLSKARNRMKWQQWYFRDSIYPIVFAYIQRFDVNTNFKAEDDAFLSDSVMC